MTGGGWRTWVPRRAMLRQYAPSEWLAMLLASRLRVFLRGRASFGEEFASLEHALGRGFTVRREGPQTVISLRDPRLGDLAIRLRRGTSDFAVYHQCLVECHYRAVADLARRGPAARGRFTIVDAGANIGLSALFFARRIPGAEIWCIEPDPEAGALCRRNLDANGLTGVPVLAEAIWPSPSTLALRHDHRDGRSWSTAVAPALPEGTGVVPGVPVGSVLQRMGVDDLDLLKLDIEGAEETLFADRADVDSWLPRVRRLAIEVHTDAAGRLVLPALARHGMRVVPHGELLIAVKAAEERDLLGALEEATAESFGVEA